MFAIPNQSMNQWEAAIREAAWLGPTHLSTYCLTFEEDTALYIKLAKGELKIDEDPRTGFLRAGAGSCWSGWAMRNTRFQFYPAACRPPAQCQHPHGGA